MLLTALSWRRRASVVPTALAAALLTVLSGLVTAPAQADNRVTPGNFTGYGFDQCNAPSQEAMDAWLTGSPFWAVGIYIAGDSRYCKTQENLTPTWVATQLRHGWRLLPLTVGRQASCSTVDRYQGNRISGDPTDNYAKAREQGRVEATTTVAAARELGISARSTLWFDLEHFDASRLRCRESALSFLSAWTRRLHALGYVSGVYSSASSGIRALDDARVLTPGRFTMPDRVWIADWNGRADVYSAYVRSDGWMPGGRVHQYRGGHDERHGGVTINIDSNYMSLGRGSVARAPLPTCGVRVDYKTYRILGPGARHEQVKAVKCLLRQKRLFSLKITKNYNLTTERAMRRFQESRSLPATGKVTRRTWMRLLTEGITPVSKVGSTTHAIRRIQRGVNAATTSRIRVTGVYDEATAAAVRTYQAQVGLTRTGVVAADTWEMLRAGRF
ncbi:MAG TPA: glycoside hydrolase domain-containing protein [Nocardioidaceae bacterium]|nr:glycoside hydrolase domain-containing protein [Nocardioidaceae bacterium]